MKNLVLFLKIAEKTTDDKTRNQPNRQNAKRPDNMHCMTN